MCGLNVLTQSHNAFVIEPIDGTCAGGSFTGAGGGRLAPTHHAETVVELIQATGTRGKRGGENNNYKVITLVDLVPQLSYRSTTRLQSKPRAISPSAWVYGV
jgi:hypothetical protein